MRVEPASRQVGCGTVTQMPAGRQVEAEDRSARLQQREEHRLVGLRARMRLHIGVLAIEQLPGTVDCRLFDDIEEPRPAMKAIAGVALKRLVGDLVAQGIEHRATDDVLGCDQHNLLALPARLAGQCIRDVRVGAVERTGEKGRYGHSESLRLLLSEALGCGGHAALAAHALPRLLGPVMQGRYRGPRVQYREQVAQHPQRSPRPVDERRHALHARRPLTTFVPRGAAVVNGGDLVCRAELSDRCHRQTALQSAHGVSRVAPQQQSASGPR